MADDQHLKNLAAQFRSPSGELGNTVAENMNRNNQEMIFHAFELLNVRPGECVVEIGPGKAIHVENWLKALKPIRYRGFDHSEDMVNLSNELVKQWDTELLKGSEVSFELIDGENYPLKNGTVDKIITVNTLYFIANIDDWLKELYRILRKSGLCNITFALPEFMEKIPFTQYNFKLYTAEEFEEFCKKSPFSSYQIVFGENEVIDIEGRPLLRKFVSFLLRK